MKLISNEEYKEYYKLKQDKPFNVFLKKGFRANMLSLSFEQIIITIMKKCNLKEIEIEDTYICETDFLEVEQTPFNSKIIKIKEVKNK